jgi:hypothetical protein
MPSTRITQLVIGIAAAFGMAAVSVSAIGNVLSAVAVLGAAARRHGRLRVSTTIKSLSISL